MRILYVIDKPNLLGSERHLLDILRYFRERHDVLLIAYSHGLLLNELKKIQINYIIIQAKWFFGFSNILRFVNIIKKFQPDIIHAHQPKAIFYSSIISRLLNIPVIITVHSRPIDHALQHRKSKIKYFSILQFHYIIQFISELFSTKTIFVSRTMIKNGFFPNKAVLIYNWVSPGFLSRQYKKYIFDKRKPLNILSVGTISYGKGYDLLIQVLWQLKENNIDFMAKIVGDGDENFKKELNEQIKKYALSEKIIFLGYQNKLQDLYEEADIFMLFSRAETFGLVYAEAMYFGLPIFAKRLEVLKEIVPNCNFLCDDFDELRNGLISLLNDDKLYKKISLINKEEAKKKFDYIKNMMLLEEIYSEL